MWKYFIYATLIALGVEIMWTRVFMENFRSTHLKYYLRTKVAKNKLVNPAPISQKNNNVAHNHTKINDVGMLENNAAHIKSQISTLSSQASSDLLYQPLVIYVSTNCMVSIGFLRFDNDHDECPNLIKSRSSQ